MGTVLKMKDKTSFSAIGCIPYLKSTKHKSENKRVCIIGNGEFGFKQAQNLFGVADHVTLLGQSPHRLSDMTIYTGDVRVKYLQVRKY